MHVYTKNISIFFSLHGDKRPHFFVGSFPTDVLYEKAPKP